MAGFNSFLKTTTKKHKSSIPGSAKCSSHGGRTPSSISRNISFCNRQQQVEELEHVFNKFDVNGDGRISSSELRSIMSGHGQTVSNNEILAMIHEVDSDGDRFIDLREFIELNTKGVDSDEIMVNLYRSNSRRNSPNSSLPPAIKIPNRHLERPSNFALPTCLAGGLQNRS